jgi:predicted TIM-barrel fold metal-dependent hydrolase
MIIDMHVHLSDNIPFCEWSWKQWFFTPTITNTAEQHLKKMDNSRPKIDKSLVFGFHSLHSDTINTMEKNNDYIDNVVKKYPDRYIGAVLIDPSWGDKAIKELKRVVKKGIRVVKIKFTSVFYPANCLGAQKLLQEVDDLGLLPVIHSDWTMWSNPSIIGNLASNYPDLKIVLQHFGLSQSLEAIEVAKVNKNIYVDTSAVIQPRNIERFIHKVSPDRIIFGSDTIRSHEWTMPQEEINRVLKLNINKDNIKKIFGTNAESLLKSVGVVL